MVLGPAPTAPQRGSAGLCSSPRCSATPPSLYCTPSARTPALPSDPLHLTLPFVVPGAEGNPLIAPDAVPVRTCSHLIVPIVPVPLCPPALRRAIPSSGAPTTGTTTSTQTTPRTCPAPAKACGARTSAGCWCASEIRRDTPRYAEIRKDTKRYAVTTHAPRIIMPPTAQTPARLLCHHALLFARTCSLRVRSVCAISFASRASALPACVARRGFSYLLNLN